MMDIDLRHISDGDLLRSASEDREAGFRELVSRYKDGLYTFLRGYLRQYDLVEDAFQETFVQAYTHRDSFNACRPLKPWLFTIAANTAKNMLRRSRGRTPVLIGSMSKPDGFSFEQILNTLASEHDNPYERLVRRETAEAIRAVVAEMPESQREILILAYFHRFSYKEMMRILAIPLGTVKSRLHSAVACFARDWQVTLAR
jgi:RNA polymerase sigma-70 factor (ECF subfamily)